ncbi:hypothetical protein ERX37_08795 [Macrococcus hajekii]|uniref:Uncharacterized protein n=1 Tax=Macrococcus hajekii TaxID=198482 RepID=A0A4R6BJ93_9STAP|nr:hypothetical protein [Macrococcus hajekii]TDM01581.1 hypothetical protein ERX37_08795 [Macrococcus hajekii]GGB01192.1 hypothetical protein GCM10007190_06590 [Macrococcus hajekii]
MREQIEVLILDGQFERVRQLMTEHDFMEFEEAFIGAAQNTESVLFYTFIVEEMKKNETAELHDLAFLLLVYPLSELTDAFKAAYYHAERSVQLTESKEVKSLLQLLFLYTVPEPVLTDRQAYQVAKQILVLDPHNKIARDLMKKAVRGLEAGVVDINDLNRMRNA